MLVFEKLSRNEKSKIINQGGNQKRELEKALQAFIEQNRIQLTEDRLEFLAGCDGEYILSSFGICESLEELKEAIDDCMVVRYYLFEKKVYGGNDYTQYTLEELKQMFKPNEEIASNEELEDWQNISTQSDLEIFLDDYVNNNGGDHYHDYYIELA